MDIERHLICFRFARPNAVALCKHAKHYAKLRMSVLFEVQANTFDKMRGKAQQPNAPDRKWLPEKGRPL